jgi:hypothetical protein
MMSPLNDKEKLEEAIKSTESIKDALIFLGLRAAGGNYKQFHKACAKHNLVPKLSSPKDRIAIVHTANRRKWEDIFCKDSTYVNRTAMKSKLINAGILENVCECGQKPIWNGKKLKLQLDHINGVYNDHRVENLRILCPNCHSQTDTFCGKKLKKKIGRKHLRKFDPTYEELKQQLENSNFVQVGKNYGVSDNAVRKRARLLHII